MDWHKSKLQMATRGKGFYPITDPIRRWIESWGIAEGMCYLFIPHTSASLAISESYDPTARKDLESFLDRLAPEQQSWHMHDLEGADDSPSHMRALVTSVSLTIPIDEGRLSLGTWQGIYLCEHRTSPHQRSVLLRCLQVR